MKHSPDHLNEADIMAKLLSMIARNNLEDLHAGHGEISDGLMKKLNQRVRNAIYTGLHALAHERDSTSARRFIEYHLQAIPSYWEPPELLSAYRENLEPDVEGAIPSRIGIRDPQYKVALGVVRPMLDRIGKLPEGSVLRGRIGRRARLALERYGVDRYLKLSRADRKRSDSLKYLEHDLTNRATVVGMHPTGAEIAAE